jgi:hypothetical protein
MLPAVLIGAVLSALLTLPLALAAGRPRRTIWGCWPCWAWCSWPSLPDGGFRGARAQRTRDRAAGPAGGHLRCALGLAGGLEAPSMAVLGGGAPGAAALAGNELLSLRRAPRAA